MAVLTVADLNRIQDYCFESDRMRDIRGGSELIAAAQEQAKELVKGNEGEVVSAAGGNVVALFNNADGVDAATNAREFARGWSIALYELDPALRATIVHQDIKQFDVDAWRSALTEIRRAKLSGTGSVPLGGLPVTASCQRTRRPAVAWDRASSPPELIADTLVRRRDPQLRSTFLDQFKIPRKGEFKLSFPLEFDHLGREEGRQSSLAVVHLDGNGIGSFVSEQLTRSRDPKDTLTAISGKIDTVVRGSMSAVIGLAAGAIELVDGAPAVVDRYGRSFPLHTTEDDNEVDRVLLPVLPILAGGDELTLVCDGRLGLTLAAAALRAFRTGATVEGVGIGACAGVAIGHVHTPFRQLAATAHALCRSAKTCLREIEQPDTLALDWHIGTQLDASRIGVVRHRELDRTGANGQVTHRATAKPYPLEASKLGDDVCFDTVEQLVGALLDAPWSERRNKVRHLRDLLQRAHDHTEVTREYRAWRIPAPTTQADERLRRFIEAGGWATCNGWSRRRSNPGVSVNVLLDALEIVEVHFALDPQAAWGGSPAAGATTTSASAAAEP